MIGVGASATRELFAIPRLGAMGAVELTETGIAINAAERTDSDCAEKIPLDSAAPMRPKHVGTIAPFAMRLVLQTEVATNVGRAVVTEKNRVCKFD